MPEPRVECERIRLQHTGEGRDLTGGGAVSWPALFTSLSPNQQVKGKSVFLKMHNTELLMHQIVSLPRCSWHLNWLRYFCNGCWKFCPFSIRLATSSSTARQMHLGFVAGTRCWWVPRSLVTKPSSRGHSGDRGKTNRPREMVLKNSRTKQHWRPGRVSAEVV